MITTDEFLAWVEQHCAATAAPHEAAVALIANRNIIITDWRSTRSELSDCTARLVSKRRVPKFANEHTDAIGNELHHIRLEQKEVEQWTSPVPLGAAPEPSCGWCRDTGFVVAPLFLCVERPRYDSPRVVPHPGYASVLEGSVLCDRPGCTEGLRARANTSAKTPRPTLSKYLDRFGGVNVVALLEQHRRECMERLRKVPCVDNSGVMEAVARIQSRVAGTHTEAA